MDTGQKALPAVADMLAWLAAGEKHIDVTGLWGSSKALFLYLLAEGLDRPVLAVTSDAREAEALATDVSFFQSSEPDTARRCHFFPPWDVLPYDVMEPDPSIVSERHFVLRSAHTGSARVVVTTVKAFMQRLSAPDDLVSASAGITLNTGEEFGHERLIAGLAKMGYARAAMVYEPGEFAVRGGIVDVFPPGGGGGGGPVRIEFLGEMVESMRSFDPGTQRSHTTLGTVDILPVTEQPRSGMAHDLLDYFTAPPVVVVDEPERVASAASEFEARVSSSFASAGDDAALPAELYMGADEAAGRLSEHQRVDVQSLPVESRGDAGPSRLVRTVSVGSLRLADAAPEPWPDELPKLPITIFCRNVKTLLATTTINVVCPSSGRAERLMEVFAEHGVPAEHNGPLIAPPSSGGTGGGRVRVSEGELSAGFLVEEPGLLFVSSREIFGEKPSKPAPAPRAKVERFLTSLSELSAGDYVVHIEHGIGIYRGMKRLKLMGVETDFLEVAYQGEDRLYVPVDELGKLQKYIGAEGSAVRVDRLGGVAWERAKSRAKKAVEEMAGELLELYAARSVAPGHAYSPDDHIYSEMEAAFEYEETPDQMKAIEEVKEDMMTAHPMDRLVCGDVGYGKTEVAIRAAFKAALDGKQVALLVPTTLLAGQHADTFRERLTTFPVRVEMLSRFTPKKDEKGILAGIASGAVDIVIGTHRILSKDVGFKDLGLIIVDEEHRFGVKHKEKLKKLRTQVDVLTLTATPIPRTLHMSISGIRDLSVIETPPPDRQPIKTVVARFDKQLIREAVLRELERGGQVFFVHNRIESIFTVGDMLKGLVPEAKIGVAHGRMREDALEKVVSEFVAGEHNLLLCTSIIESGLDIPSANTIIINRADRFGLADLYQLRGRVGRSRTRAYAYLLAPGEESLTETAKKRLTVLSELSGLGAGFRLALHDMEIRGAGNLLGPEQSGQIAAIGFDLYTRLLEEAVASLRGDPVEHAIDPAIDLKVSAFIPEDYVQDAAHRLGIYKRLSTADDAELADITGELADRFGPLPEPAKRLMEVMEIKAIARRLKVAGVQLTPTEVRIAFSDKVNISPDALLGFLAKRRGMARYVPQYTIFIKKPAGGWPELCHEIKNSLKALL